MEDKKLKDNKEQEEQIERVELRCVTGIRLYKESEGKSVYFEKDSKITAKKPFSKQVEEYYEQKVLIPYIEEKSERDKIIEKLPETEKYFCLRNVRYIGRVYKAGEVFPKDAPENILNDLKNSKAIEEV